MELKPGDVVALKSGGHPLTVVEVDADNVSCLWMGGEGDLFRETLPLAALELVDAEEMDDEDEDENDEDEDEAEEDEKEDEDEPKKKEEGLRPFWRCCPVPGQHRPCHGVNPKIQGRWRTSALVRIADSRRISREVRKVPHLRHRPDYESHSSGPRNLLDFM